jgi:hypothetical protein
VKIAQQKRFLLLRIRSRFVSDLGWRGRLRRAGSLRPDPRNAEKKRQQALENIRRHVDLPSPFKFLALSF